MPIPTDTYWSIRRLNLVFALSALALFGITTWAIVQDWNRDWRQPQRQARIWETALVDDKIQRSLTPEEQAALVELEKQITAGEAALQQGNKTYQDLVDQRRKLESDRSTLEFRLNNLKSTVQVSESNLQDAIAAGDSERAEQLSAELEAPRARLAEWNERLAALGDEMVEIGQKIDAQTGQLEALKRKRSQLASDVELLRKKAAHLDPSRQGGIEGLAGALSSIIRDAPLMGFVNPSERVQQVVLPDVQTDVAFMKITTVDRCTTCHINIAKKDFSEEEVLAYLEEQVATARKFSLPGKAPTGAAAPSATADKPGGVAMVEFWHGWALKVAPAQVARNNTRLGAIARAVGADKPATVTYDGQTLAEFKFDPSLTEPAAVARQNEILLALIDALYRWSKLADATSTQGKTKVVIAASADERATTLARNAALRYAEELKNGLRSSLEADSYALLLDRYRYALTGELNIERRRRGLASLDASSVLLAHPKLDLYVDVDSPHSFEALGCTSCHDGSGQETDFVLAAHTARDIWVDSRTGVPVLEQQLERAPSDEHGRFDLSSMLDASEEQEGLHFTPPSTQPASKAYDLGPVAYADPVTGAQGQAMRQHDYWVKTYEPKAPRSFKLVYHEWDWPMRSPDYLQANCARCHTDVYDIKDTAPVLYEGRQLFTQLGCVNCHQMDSIPADQNRKVGTDLRHVTSKLSPEYLNTWIWAPKAFRPTTKMPHFFMLENNSSDEEIRRTRQEARAITEYLARTATPLVPAHTLPVGSKGSAEAGKALFNTLGCLACHQNLNDRGQEWITTDLVKRAGMKAEEARAAYEKMSYNERQLYVQQHLSEPAILETSPKYPDNSAKPVFVQVGPELSAVGTKLLAGRTPDQARQWLFDWLKEPRHYSDYTIMPQLRLNDQQAMDLVEYLLEQKRTTADPDDTWTAGLAEMDSAKLIELTSLQLRSRYSIATSLIKADDEAELSTLAAAALTTPVKPAEEARAEVATMNKDQKRLVFLGQKMIAHYGCMSCHAINGMETTSSPCTNLSAWGQQAISKLDFGYLDHHKLEGLPPTSQIPLVNALSAEAANLAHESVKGREVSRPLEAAWPHVDHTRNAWIKQKLKNSRAYDRGRALLEPGPGNPGKPYDKLKMPTFYLNDEQIHAIVVFVLSNRDRLVSTSLVNKATHEQAKVIARGRELTERYNCVGCHQIEKNAPPIQQYFKVEDVITKAPPSLRGEGNKIQHSWGFNFFKHVEPLRPLIFDGIRMPSFPASDDEWTAIIAYFNAVSKKESKQLGRRIDPVLKYIDARRKATTQPSETVSAGDDWWQQRAFAATAEALKQWGLTYGHIRPIEVGPTASAADLTKVYKTLLFKAQFTRELYNAPYPFVETPRPQISDEKFALGEQLFYEMQCLKCHVLGDPEVPGANKTPTAPNLTLAHERLQRRWVRHWIQEPNIIQVGTAMPPFLTGLALFQLDGQPWPASQGAAPAEVARIEAKYGKTADEQADLVLDFLYAAGVRRHTGIQPPTAPPTTAPKE